VNVVEVMDVVGAAEVIENNYLVNVVNAIRYELANRRYASVEGWRPRRDLNPCYRRERAMS
jgi:hypothetical protein